MYQAQSPRKTFTKLQSLTIQTKQKIAKCIKELKSFTTLKKISIILIRVILKLSDIKNINQFMSKLKEINLHKMSHMI